MNKEILNGFSELTNLIDGKLETACEHGPLACKPGLDELWRVMASFYSYHSQLSPDAEMEKDEYEALGEIQNTLARYLSWWMSERDDEYHYTGDVA